MSLTGKPYVKADFYEDTLRPSVYGRWYEISIEIMSWMLLSADFH